MNEMKFDKRVQPGVRQKTAEEIAAANEKQRAEMVKLMKDRMIDHSDTEDVEDSVEKIHEKKEEVKEVAPLAYSMEDGTLLNHRDELSEALRNIKKTDSDGESAEEESDDESGDEEDESGDEETPAGDDEMDEKSDEEGNETVESEEFAALAKIVDEESGDDGDADDVEKLPPLTLALEKASSVLSSGRSFRKSLLSFTNKERIVFLTSLCRKIISGTDADRPVKLKSLFEYSVLAVMRHEVFDEEECSIAPVLYELAQKSPATGHTVAQMLREFANKVQVKLS